MGSYTGDAFEIHPTIRSIHAAHRRRRRYRLRHRERRESSSFPGTPSVTGAILLPKLTQYWRIPRTRSSPTCACAQRTPDLLGIARFVPGASRDENFDVRQRYIPGQSYIFGVTAKSRGSSSPPF